MGQISHISFWLIFEEEDELKKKQQKQSHMNKLNLINGFKKYLVTLKKKKKL